MFQISMKPVAVIATLQPTLLMWLMAIAFFVTLAFVAWISKGKSWVQLVNIFAAMFVAVWIAAVGVVSWLTPITVMKVQVVSASTQP